MKALPPPPMDEMLFLFQRWSKELTERVSRMGDNAWDRVAQFYRNGKLASEQPMGEFLWFSLFDTIHHRGQLCAYLPRMGGKVPSIYWLWRTSRLNSMKVERPAFR